MSGQDESAQRFTDGQIIKARVAKKTDKGLYLDIKYKAEPFVAMADVPNWENIVEGQDIDVYIEQNEGINHPICTIYFDRSERKVQKLWNKIKKRYEADPVVTLRQLDSSKFKFTAEQYMPPIIGEVETTGNVAAQQAVTTGDKKGKKGKKK